MCQIPKSATNNKLFLTYETAFTINDWSKSFSVAGDKSNDEVWKRQEEKTGTRKENRDWGYE